jgi:hypothetical protein
VEFVVGKVALGLVYLKVIPFSLVNIIPSWISTLISRRDGATYTFLAAIRKHGLFLKHNRCVRFQVLTAASVKFRVFWDVALCSYVEVDRRFRVAYCLHYYGDE